MKHCRCRASTSAGARSVGEIHPSPVSAGNAPHEAANREGRLQAPTDQLKVSRRVAMTPPPARTARVSPRSVTAPDGPGSDRARQRDAASPKRAIRGGASARPATLSSSSACAQTPTPSRRRHQRRQQAEVTTRRGAGASAHRRDDRQVPRGLYGGSSSVTRVAPAAGRSVERGPRSSRAPSPPPHH